MVCINGGVRCRDTESGNLASVRIGEVGVPYHCVCARIGVEKVSRILASSVYLLWPDVRNLGCVV